MADPLIQAGNQAAQNTLTPSQQSLANNQNVPAGQAGSPWTSQNSTQPMIMSPTQAFNNNPIPVQEIKPQDTSPGIVAEAQQTVDSITKSLASTPTPTEDKQQSVLNDLASLTSQEGQKGADTLAEQNKAGIQGKQQVLLDAQNELTAKTAKYNALQANLGGNGGVETSAVLAAQNAGLLKAAAADIGVTNAKITAAQGNLSLANQQVKDAIDLKYSTIEAQIKTKLAHLDALMPQLNREQATRALAQQKLLQDQERKMAEEKAQAKDNVQLAMAAGVATKFVNKNGQFFDANTGLPFASPQDFFKAAGVTSFEQAYQQGLVSDVTPAKLQDINTLQQMIAKYPDAGVKITDTLEQAMQKLKGSAIYRKDTYIAPSSGSSSSLLDQLLAGNSNAIDANSQSILAQTGLSIPAFNFLTQGTAALTRLSAGDRTKIMSEAQNWANTKGIDISTFQSRFKAYNETLSKNIERFNNSSIAENELKGTIENLAAVADDKNFGKLKAGNVAKLFAGEQVNDPATMAYAVHLNQLRSEFAYYNAAVQGKSSADLIDYQEAERTIRNGISSGSLKGFQTSLESSVDKMGKTLQGSVDRSNKQVWDLFGVGGNYNPGGQKSGFSVTAPDGQTYNFNSQADLDKFKQAAGIK